MNLNTFLKINPNLTLEVIRATPIIEDKMKVGSGTARGFFVSNGIWTTLKQAQADTAHPLFALADAIVVTASDASSYFGLDPSTPSGAYNIQGAQLLVDAGVMTAQEKLDFLDLAVRKTYPFAEVTQEEVDAILFIHNLEGNTEAEHYTLQGFPTDAPEAFIIKTRTLLVESIFKVPAPIATSVTISMDLLNSRTGTWSTQVKTYRINIPKGSTGQEIRISDNFSARKMRFTAICTHKLNHELEIREV